MMTPLDPLLTATIASTLIQPASCSLINATYEKKVTKAGKEQEDGILP